MGAQDMCAARQLVFRQRRAFVHPSPAAECVYSAKSWRLAWRHPASKGEKSKFSSALAFLSSEEGAASRACVGDACLRPYSLHATGGVHHTTDL